MYMCVCVCFIKTLFFKKSIIESETDHFIDNVTLS